MRPEAIKSRILLPVSTVLVVLLGAFVLMAYRLERTQLDGELERRMAQISHFLESHCEEDAEEMNALLDIVGQNVRLRDALEAGDRGALLEASEPIFRRLRNSAEITHFYFSGPDRVNLLRVHKPDRFGDVIDRFTTLEAERTGESAMGVELGPLGTFTLRVVQPWFREGRLLGFVELGHEVEHVVDVLRRTFDIELCAIIEKRFLSREDWESGLRMLGREGDWDRFPDCVVIDEVPPSVPGAFFRRLETEGIAGLRETFEARSRGRVHHVAALPLVDAAGRGVGCLVAILDISDRRAAMIRFVLTVAVIAVAAGGLLFFFFLTYLGRIERKLGLPG
jgi:hypothetical protein